tara:strand:+ start:1586 stop:2380 length:795 start_codon:yes stop_codon:yes gene_type:complete
MNIGIIGLGAVGGTIKLGFKELGYDVYSFDIKDNTTIHNVLDTQICYICVPTPQSEEGECDITIVDKVIGELIDNSYKGVIAIKSTVKPGTTEHLKEKYSNNRICFVPEFLRERSALTDFTENHDVCIIGTQDKLIFNLIKETHGHYPRKFVQTTPTEAEVCKYFNNVYNATLVTFANSFYEVCKSLDVDYKKVKSAIVNRDHINDIYLDCNKNLRGFGGMCLPKDTSAMSYLSKTHNLDVEFFDTILSENKKYKTTVFKGMRK